MLKKRVSTKKKTSTKKAAQTMSSAPKSSTSSGSSLLSKSFLAKEQEEFHRAHPNAEKLIAVFIVLVLALAWLYFARFGFARMYY